MKSPRVLARPASSACCATAMGPTVMLRADMDALPVHEQPACPTRAQRPRPTATGNTVPVMHACGHDMHVTWLVGAATTPARSARHMEGHADGGFPARRRDSRRRAGDD